MAPNAKLFRAIVELGVSQTAPACDEHGKCPPTADCTPPVDGGIAITDGRMLPDAPRLRDAAPQDVVIII
jgi:hypothetical protein